MTNKPSRNEYQELLIRYLEGKCSEEEKKLLDRWYESFDDDGQDSVDSSDVGISSKLKQEMFDNISKGIEAKEEEIKKASHDGKAPRMRVLELRRWTRIAAMLAIGIGIGTAIVSQVFFQGSRPATSDTVIEAPLEEHLNVTGPATIYLSDGSVVWLEERSTLAYPRAFPGGLREVTLAGEAFFDVAKENDRPFIIHSTNFTTRVLGTSFKIKDDDREQSPEVEVVTGKVMVSVKDSTSARVKEVILKPNRKAVYSKKNNSLVESAVESSVVHKLPAKSRLEFNEVALKDIVKVLNVVHGVNITVSSERMKNCIITADLSNETLDASIAILSKAINADFTVRGKDIILSGDGCAIPEK